MGTDQIRDARHGAGDRAEHQGARRQAPGRQAGRPQSEPRQAGRPQSEPHHAARPQSEPHHAARSRSERDHAARRQVERLHRRVQALTGRVLPLRLWDGTELGEPDAGFRIVLHHPWSLRAMLWPPSDLAAGEAYVEGAIDIEGDPVAAMAAGAQLADHAPRGSEKLALGRDVLALPRPPRRSHDRRARLHGRRHSPTRDRQAIAFHYDLPHDFYASFLDRELVYSCAYFRDGDEDLDVAQRRKLDVVCRKLRLRSGQRLLDIGGGWGALVRHAARHYGVRGLAVTLSQTQADAGRERVAAEGLSDRVEIRLADYRELDDTFDAVASVGMVEHVGPEHLREYFAGVYRLTAPGGLFCNHGIVTGTAERTRRDRGRDFTHRYVFPDGGLVPAWRMVQRAQQPGFGLLDVEQLRPHYALTLRRWVRRLQANHDRAVAAASEADYRIWLAYMASAAVGFETAALGVIQVLLGKPPLASLPLGRDWMLPAS